MPLCWKVKVFVEEHLKIIITDMIKIISAKEKSDCMIGHGRKETMFIKTVCVNIILNGNGFITIQNSCIKIMCCRIKQKHSLNIPLLMASFVTSYLLVIFRVIYVCLWHIF